MQLHVEAWKQALCQERGRLPAPAPTPSAASAAHRRLCFRALFFRLGRRSGRICGGPAAAPPAPAPPSRNAASPAAAASTARAAAAASQLLAVVLLLRSPITSPRQTEVVGSPVRCAGRPDWSDKPDAGQHHAEMLKCKCFTCFGGGSGALLPRAPGRSERLGLVSAVAEGAGPAPPAIALMPAAASALVARCSGSAAAPTATSRRNTIGKVTWKQ